MRLLYLVSIIQLPVVHSSPVMPRRNSRDHNFKGVAPTIADKVKPPVKVHDEVFERWLASTYAPTPEASIEQLMISCTEYVTHSPGVDMSSLGDLLAPEETRGFTKRMRNAMLKDPTRIIETRKPWTIKQAFVTTLEPKSWQRTIHEATVASLSADRSRLKVRKRGFFF